MASSSSTMHPITNHQQLHPTTDAAAAPPNAIRLFVSNLTQTVRNSLSNRRPWAELIDRSALSKPDNFSDATSRIRKNYTYFRINYLTIITCILGFSMITHPFSLLLFATLLAAWLYLYLFRSADTPLVIFGRQFSNKETVGALILSTVLVIFLTNVGYVLVSALMVGVAVVCAHAAFRAPEDLFLDEQDSPATGFISFLTGAGSNGVGASHMMSARV